MDFGAAMFFTDYSMGPAALGRALEERGFESLWAPEHTSSHCPASSGIVGAVERSDGRSTAP